MSKNGGTDVFDSSAKWILVCIKKQKQMIN